MIKVVREPIRRRRLERAGLVGVLIALTNLGGCVGGPTARGPTTETIDLDHVPVVWGFGGKYQGTIVVSGDAWETIAAGFDPPAATPQAEREQVRDAVVTLETITGEQTPTRYDIAKNEMPEVGKGQLDCLAESQNTTMYLEVLEQEGLLKWHDVEHRVFRVSTVFDTHYSACLRDRTTDVPYVVDTWFGDNGDPAIIVEVDRWREKDPK